ncbi:mechanosensitive ion channel [Pusillimonas sp. TS35]|uniref:mechanosensitive ion channel family protein n=1 Tax=Paracandidimonas lactea TaxID=2895524 RepID=UPI00136FFA35|nr:mechanosensitive ion channel family protein [Paracandidimonas lactea]MYN13470.1 mechanosensitive ion channel [Pusillimonas sp. TS35]
MDWSLVLMFPQRHPWMATGLVAVLAVLAALVAHRLLAALVRRLTLRRPLLASVARFTFTPGRWVLVGVALAMVCIGASDTLPGIAGVRQAVKLALIAVLAWLAVRATMGLGEGIIVLNPADVADNLGARRIHTQTRVLVRCMNMAIVLVALAAMLMTFPAVRQIGASLMASAGLMGLVAGFAARPVLGNLIAGLQIAITQPIRLDDVLIVQGEWGRVEEITGSYVVVRIWDERRLVVPLQWFIENPFQNWTRRTAQIIGTVFLWADYRLPLAPLREELDRLCREAPEWDGRVCLLQVTEAGERAMQLRALVSAADSGLAWDLRCKVREGLVAYIQQHHPECLPRMRAELGTQASEPGGPLDTAGQDASSPAP